MTAVVRPLIHFMFWVAVSLGLSVGFPWAGGIPAVPALELIAVPAGGFISGSDRAEREIAYGLDETAYGHSRTRQGRWYEGERKRAERRTGAFEIMVKPVTNAQYAAFVSATGQHAPEVDAETWQGYRLVHPYRRTRRHAWVGGKPPEGRAQHPVVLVSHQDARAYAAWLSQVTGRNWRLPTELEWEKAVRGEDGRIFPWGSTWRPEQANTHDRGPFDTLPVGRFPEGAGPYGLLDGAGQVYEWTSTPGGKGRFLVKGGSWDDKGCGVCRPAARHGRPEAIKHILIGFRLVAE